ncbi:MAG TPA: N-6 DNA methylase, partial [Gemmatimonadaceae bacterium]|nr:N-6 DNA methylase [Gemmatimonadaceae bacterium]
MLSLRAAATLLAAEPGRASLAAIAAAAAFDAAPLPLHASSLAALGLTEGIADAAVIGGRGATRAILLRTHASLRDVVRSTASALARRAPQLLWLLVAEDASGTVRAIATWNADRATPRITLLLVDRARVMDSDAETLCALAAAGDGSETLRHARWLEVLGREALTRRFYRTLASIVDGAAETLPRRIGDDDRRTLALLATSRLVFLAFLEAKGWLDGDREFLANRFADAIATGGGIHRRVIDPLFFGTLNTPPPARAPRARAFGRLPYLNGGLFTRSPLERHWRATRFPDEALTPVVDELLSRYRLTTREQAVGLSEAAVDPEMLGRAFETLMASRERRASGAFYTPHQIVAEATSEALVSYIASQGMRDEAARTLVAGGEADVGDRARAASALSALRLVDPACGSGAFLVHALERVADLRARCGAPGDPSTLRRETLARSIFGVDSNPTAVWLCELRLWLAALIDE